MTPAEQLDFLERLFSDQKPMLNAYADICEEGAGKHEPEEVDEVIADMEQHIKRMRKATKA
jgi:hypothetical protein